MELTLVPSLQIKPRKYSAGKYMWHRFLKGTRSCLESKQNECLCRSSRPKGSLKKVLWEISWNSQKKNMCWNLFFDKKLSQVKLRVFRAGAFLWNLRKCWNTFFAEHHQTTASDCSSINSSEEKIGKQNRKLLKIESKWQNRFQKQSFANFKLGFLKNCVNFTRKHLYRSPKGLQLY